MLTISDYINKLPGKSLKAWVSAKEKDNRGPEWERELSKLKKRYDKGTGSKSKEN